MKKSTPPPKVTGMHHGFAEWLNKRYGAHLTIDPAVVAAVIHDYPEYRKSPENAARREEARKARGPALTAEERAAERKRKAAERLRERAAALEAEISAQPALRVIEGGKKGKATKKGKKKAKAALKVVAPLPEEPAAPVVLEASDEFEEPEEQVAEEVSLTEPSGREQDEAEAESFDVAAIEPGTFDDDDDWDDDF